MSFLRTILPFLSLCLLSTSAAASTSMAEEVEQVRHGRHFPTTSRKMVVITPDSELSRRITERLAAHGAVVVDDFISRLFSARVVVKRVAKIYGLTDAYSIEVSKSKVSIKYTSPAMLERAIPQFYFLFDAPYGQRIIRGTNVYYFADQPQKATKSTLKSNKAGIIDGVTTTLTTAQIENAIRNQLRTNPRSDVMVAMANRNVFRLDFNVFRGINPSLGSISPNQTKYTTDQIRRFVATAREAGGEFVPAIDLLSDNAPFEEYTGHKINSVEGMRFVRAMIEQCARSWNIKRICIGRRENSAAEKRYIEFLSAIATAEGVTLIVL